MVDGQEVAALKARIQELEQELFEAEQWEDELTKFSMAQTDVLLKFGVKEVAGQEIG
jgi:hypothetical protein